MKDNSLENQYLISLDKDYFETQKIQQVNLVQLYQNGHRISNVKSVKVYSIGLIQYQVLV